MNKIFAVMAVIYVLAVVAAVAAAAWTTLWAYNLDQRMVSDTVTAAIINTAAVAVMGFFGGFDMLFSIWQFMRNQEAEKAREAERAEERKAQQAEREVREAERAAERAEERKAQQAEREAMFATMRAEREEFMTQLQAQIQAERERSDAHYAEMLARNDALTARLMELTEVVIQRANGNSSDV